MFLNLLSNARQAMEGSTIAGSPSPAAGTRPAPSREGGGSDTGKGFTEEQGRRLFQPFFTTRKGGHGLGLSISRAIIQDHKGAIEASGAPGAGATFTIRFPAAQQGGESPNGAEPARRDA